MFRIIVLFTLFLIAVSNASAVEEITIEPNAITGNIGDVVSFTITVHQVCEERCPLSIEDTQIHLYGLEKVSETPWVEVESYVFQKTIEVKILDENATLKVIRECPKFGTIFKEVKFEGATSPDTELPEISGKELQSMTLEEVAKAYGVDVELLISELGVPATKDTRVKDLKKYGINPFDVKEAAVRAAKLPTQGTDLLPRTVSTGHANWFDVGLLLILLVASTAIFFAKKYSLRYLILATYFGYNFLLREAHLCTVGTPQRILFRLPEIAAGHFVEWGALFFLPVIFTLGFGRIYCGFVCPYGAYQEFLSKITKKKITVPHKIDKTLRFLKYALLVLLVSLALHLEDIVGLEFDPFKFLFRSEGTYITIALLVVLTLASVFIYRPWCKYICPLGAIYAVLSKFSWFKLEYVEDECVGCKLCNKACPMQAIECGKVDDFECVRCGDCVVSCKRHVIKFTSSHIRVTAVVLALIFTAIVFTSASLQLQTGDVGTTKSYIHKETGQVYVVPGLLGGDCATCHYSSSPSKKDLTQFAIDWVENGRDFNAINNIDSDGDGYSNEAEWNAGTNPGNSESHP